MPYIPVPPSTAASIRNIVDVAGASHAADLLGVSLQQVRNLARGTGRVFRESRRETGRVERQARLVEPHIDRLQHLSFKIAKDDRARFTAKIARQMEGPRTPRRKRQYIRDLIDIGMDPKDLPDELET